MSATFTTLSMERIAGAPPRFKAKTAGVLYLLSVLAASLAEIFVHRAMNVAGGLIVASVMIAATLFFYDVLSPMSRRLALVAASFNLVGLAFELLRLQPQGVNVAVVFNGFYCILIGCLVFRSTSVPRSLGALIAAGGLGWLTLVSSVLASYLSPYNLALGILGEGAVCLWLLVMGVNAQPWKEQDSAPQRKD
jgi:Domain of unknown function (DUF4386)